MRERHFDASIYRLGYRRQFRPDEPSNPFHRLYEAKRAAVLDYFAGVESRRILDAGGGYGRLAGPLAERHDVTLCDISSEMLDEARGRWPGLKLVEADATRLPFEGGAFDAVLALDLLTHLPSLEAGVKELARVARPGGDVVFDTSNASPWWVPAYPRYVGWRPWRLLRTMAGGGVLPEWRETVRHDRQADVQKAVVGTGLTLERLQPFGPLWTAKWHLWWTTKRDVAPSQVP